MTVGTAGMHVTAGPVEFCECRGHSFVSNASRVNSFCGSGDDFVNLNFFIKFRIKRIKLTYRNK